MLGILFSEHLSTSHETHYNLSIRKGAGWLRMDFHISLLRNGNEESQLSATFCAVLVTAVIFFVVQKLDSR